MDRDRISAITHGDRAIRGGAESDEEQADIFDYACHEVNYAMRNILSGARADERAGASRK